MRRQELIDFWKEEEKQPFSGWDFAHLDGRLTYEKEPWSYTTHARELMRQSASLLDMGTGGGEILLQYRQDWPPAVTVTEDYPPNVKLALDRLTPLGVRVIETVLSETSRLPFTESEFDLVLNRHSGFNPAEVARILTPGGTFLTQQVHGLSAADLLERFSVRPSWPEAVPEHYLPALRKAGLSILAWQDWTGRMSFSDVGALVYYLKAVPWTVPGFGVDTHLNNLLSLQEGLEKGVPLEFSWRLYLIEAQK